MTPEEKERQKIVAHLRALGDSRPPEHLRARHPEWTDAVLILASAMFMAAADQIEMGAHLQTQP